MARAHWYRCARIGACVWFILAFLMTYDYQQELDNVDIISTRFVYGEPGKDERSMPSDDGNLQSMATTWQLQREKTMGREFVKLKWFKMALLIFVILVLFPLALCILEKEEKQKSHSVTHLWKWARSSYLVATLLYACIFVFSFSSFLDLLPDEEEGRGILLSQTDDSVEMGESASLDGKEGYTFIKLLRWGIGVSMTMPFIFFTLLIAYLGYIRFTERSFLCGRGKELCRRWWLALLTPEEVSRDISMMALPLLVICTEVSLHKAHKLLPGQQLILLSSSLSLFISGFILPVIASLIAKGAVCHLLQNKDKDDEDVKDDSESTYTSLFEATSKACAAGIVICVPLTMLSALWSMPVLRSPRNIISLLGNLKSWITSLATGGLGVVQFNLRRSLVMGDRASQILLITSSVSLVFIMASSSLFSNEVQNYLDSVNFDYSAVGKGVSDYNLIPSTRIAIVDIVHVFGFALTALFAYNRLKYL